MDLYCGSHARPPVENGKYRVFIRDVPGEGWVWIADETIDDFKGRRQKRPDMEYRVEDASGQSVEVT